MERIDDTTWIDDEGCRIVRVHTEGTCAGEHCAIHNPSDHVMNRYPRVMSHEIGALVERVCPHGAHHPDSDSLAYMIEARVRQYKSINELLAEQGDEPVTIDLVDIAQDYGSHTCCEHKCCVHAYPRTWLHRQ